MIEAKAKTVIHKPVAAVFSYTIDPANAQEWYHNVKKSEWDQAGPLQVGAKANLLTHIMGKDYPFTYEIKELVPDQKLLMVSSAGPFPMESEYLFRAMDEASTEVTIINRASPGGIPSFLVSVVKGKVQKTIEEDIVTLKRIIESL